MYMDAPPPTQANTTEPSPFQRTSETSGHWGTKLIFPQPHQEAIPGLRCFEKHSNVVSVLQQLILADELSNTRIQTQLLLYFM